jgi:hypothetical protein
MLCHSYFLLYFVDFSSTKTLVPMNQGVVLANLRATLLVVNNPNPKAPFVSFHFEELKSYY